MTVQPSDYGPPEVTVNEAKPKRFRQHDVTRALRAARAAGIEVQRFEIDPATGKITIIANVAGKAEPANALDQWLAENAGKA